MGLFYVIFTLRALGSHLNISIKVIDMICFIFWKILLTLVENMGMKGHADSTGMLFLWHTLGRCWVCWQLGRLRK